MDAHEALILDSVLDFSMFFFIFKMFVGKNRIDHCLEL